MPTIQELLDQQNEIPEFLQPYGPTMSGPGGQQIGTADLGNAIPALRARDDQRKYNQYLDQQRGLEQQKLAFQEAHPPHQHGRFVRFLETMFPPARVYGQLERENEMLPAYNMAAKQQTLGHLMSLYQPPEQQKPMAAQVGGPGSILWGENGRVLGYNPAAPKAAGDWQGLNPKWDYRDPETNTIYPATAPEDDNQYVSGIGGEIADDLLRHGVNAFRPGTKAWALANEAIAKAGTEDGDKLAKFLRDQYMQFFEESYRGKVQYGQSPTPEMLNTIKEDALSAMGASMEGLGTLQGNTPQRPPTMGEWDQQNPQYSNLPEEDRFNIYDHEMKKGKPVGGNEPR